MLGSLVLNAVRATAYPLLWLRRQALVPQGAWVVVKLEGQISEIERPQPRWRKPSDLLIPTPAKPHVTVAGLRELVAAIAQDDRVGGVLFRFGALGCGWAVAESLRALFGELRRAGRRTVAWLPDGATSREYFVAAAADKVIASPQATVAPLGVAASLTFVRALLARGGIEAEVFARREYKSAAEAFTRDSYSEANRRQTEALLDRLHTAFVSAIAEGRRVDEARARKLVDEGPYRAPDALREGLLDALAYEDDLVTHLGSGDVKLVAGGDYLALARSLRFRPLLPARRVGVVEIRGPIVSEARIAFGQIADARRITGALRMARMNPSLGAVVLHIDTGGGSALASDNIAREVERLREKKPVVAYFADIAASGGYYSAALANEIVAQPTTVTGSIGVIALRFAARGMLDKLGLSHEVIRRGERADLMSPYRAWDEGDRAAFDREIDGFYNDFVSIVARGRKRDTAEIEPLARGRVYAGADAHAVGLVDHLGGLDAALERARTLAGGRFAREPVVVPPPWVMPDPPEPPRSVQALMAFVGDAARSRAGLNLLQLALSSPNEHLFAYEDAVDVE
jgi:protease-4